MIRPVYQSRRHDYGVFATDTLTGRAVWARPRTKRLALALAKHLRGECRAKVSSGRAAWDAPTFRICSDVIADYR